MDAEELFCACGRSFAQTNALANHRRACKEAKMKMQEALARAQAARKRKKEAEAANPLAPVSQRQKREHQPRAYEFTKAPAWIEDSEIRSPKSNTNHGYVGQKPTNVPGSNSGSSSLSRSPSGIDASNPTQEGRRKSNRTHSGLPGRYRDMVPHSLSPLYTESHFDIEHGVAEDVSPQVTSLAAPATLKQVINIRSRTNPFGLFREYTTTVASSHDPEEECTLEDFCDVDSLRSPYKATLVVNTPESDTDHAAGVNLWPYPNRSSFLLGEWYWTGSTQKSKADFSKLINILTSDDFQSDELNRVPWNDIHRVLGSSTLPEQSLPSANFMNADWSREEVKIQVPFHRLTGARGPKEYIVGDFYRRSIVSILKEKVTGPDFQHFHLQPFDLLWEGPSIPGAPLEQPQRVYGEVYHSEKFRQMHQEVQNSPSQPPNCTLPRVVVALMFASDETHLTQFGETKLWPLYLFFGNDSKYRRCQPNLHLCHHVAYFTKLSEDFEDFYAATTGGKGVSATLAAHCARESFHSQWTIIIDDEFVQAYEFGVVITCFDGLQRRFYLRIFTYSADYKEKTIISTIRNLGGCPCPRCRIPLLKVPDLGLPTDRWWRKNEKRRDDDGYRKKIRKARNMIYKRNLAVTNQDVEGILKDESLVPTQNAFSARLSKLGFSIFETLVTDLMHEVESGTWRSLFIHLLRMLTCIGLNRIHEMDKRYREVPTFGRDTIRKFRRNCSDMKNLAARDWEDILQCSMPVFEGLLSNGDNSEGVLDDGCLLDLLFVFASWHGLAKLRIHTNSTLQLLDRATTALGNQLRRFKAEVCSKYKTKELSREAAARARRKIQTTQQPNVRGQHPPISATTTSAQMVVVRSLGPSDADIEPPGTTVLPTQETQRQNHLAATASKESTMQHPSCADADPGMDDLQVSDNLLSATSGATGGKPQNTSVSTSTRKVKTLNLATYKFHALGDYVDTIKMFGTTDSYSTEPGELEHRTAKSRYSRTSKKNYILQMTQIERRQARIRRIREKLTAQAAKSTVQKVDVTPPEHEGSPKDRYFIGKTQNHPVDIFPFLREHASDPATKHFYRELKAHLLLRVKQQLALMISERVSSIYIHRERIYKHKILRLNYTSYDVRRCQDVVNPNTTHRDIMMLANSEQWGDAEHAHPYVYARVLGIYHANVVCMGPGVDGNPKRIDFLWVRWFHYHPPLSALRLDGLSFPPVTDKGATAFVDPSDVLRACHVVPAFAKDKKFESERNLEEHSNLAGDSDDWNEYYLDRFVDRDALMRSYWGMGIGHAHHLQDFLKDHSTSCWNNPDIFNAPVKDQSSTFYKPPNPLAEELAGEEYDHGSEAGEHTLVEREDEQIVPIGDVLDVPENPDDEHDDSELYERYHMYPEDFV